jgi:ribonuclease P protein component
MGDERFLPTHRMTSSTDFQRAFRRRCSASDDRLLVFVSPSDLPHPRLGLSVSRKVGGAVVRNRWKRRIREAFRLERPQLPGGVDLVVIPRGETVARVSEIRESLVRLAGRAARRIKSQERSDIRPPLPPGEG